MLVLGVHRQNIADATLIPVDRRNPRLWQVIDTLVFPPFQGQGYGNKLFLELFKSLPPGVEITHNYLTPDGERMWRKLERRGLVRKVNPNPETERNAGTYVSRIGELQF